MLNEIYDRFIKKAEKAGYMREELVLGCGRENGGVVLIGEAPGKDEVIAQRPFVGKAGKILDEFLEANSQLAEKIIKEVAAVHGIGSVFCCKECF